LNHSLEEVYKIIANDILEGGQESQKAESHLAYAVVSMIHGAKYDKSLKGHYQVLHKKMAISNNEFQDTFYGAGNDSHFNRQVETFCPSLYNKKEFSLIIARTISEKVGWWANELMGQLGQLLQGNKRQCNIAHSILRNLVTVYPNEYDTLANTLTQIENWSKLQRNEFIAELNEVRVNEHRACKTICIPKPKRQKKTNKKRKIVVPPPSPVYKLSAYELFRLEKIAANEKKLRSLGF
jgi:hypothetical protein